MCCTTARSNFCYTWQCCTDETQRRYDNWIQCRGSHHKLSVALHQTSVQQLVGMRSTLAPACSHNISPQSPQHLTSHELSVYLRTVQQHLEIYFYNITAVQKIKYIYPCVQLCIMHAVWEVSLACAFASTRNHHVLHDKLNQNCPFKIFIHTYY